jgi:membrane dipeptidase
MGGVDMENLSKPESREGGGVTRRRFVGLAAAVGAGAPAALHGVTSWSGGEGVMQEAPVVLASLDAASPGAGVDAARAALRQARQDGVHMAFVPVVTREDYRATTRNLLRLHRILEGLDGEAEAVRRVPELRRTVASGRLAVIPHFQGLQMAMEDVAMLEEFSSAGVGVMALTHNWKNWNGDGCLERTNMRMTGLGELVVQAMNRVGVVLDLSRAGVRTSLHAIEVSSHPVIFSNSNAAAVHDHPRNLTDAQIDACAAGGGVVGVTAYAPLVAASRPTLDRVLDHVAYVAERVGPEHVGLGLAVGARELRRFPSDPLPAAPPPPTAGVSGTGVLGAIRRGLEARGFGSGAVDGVLGGNLVRVLETVWGSA